MILTGALLLVTTHQSRIKRVHRLRPGPPAQIMKHAGDRPMNKTIKHMVKQEQEELAGALVQEDVQKGEIGKVEEDAAVNAVAGLGEAFTGQGLPQGPIAKTAAASAAAVGEKMGSSKDTGKGKDKDKRKDEGNDTGKDKKHQFAKGRVAEKEPSTIVSMGGERDWFRYPVWGGNWWISRLAFVRGQFAGTIYQEIPATKTLLVKAWKAQEEFGDEAIIPLPCNYVRAKVGDKITFDVGQFMQEGEGKPKPLANNVIIRQRGLAIGEGLIKGPALTDVRTQVLYYLSDANLRTDRFFQDIIAKTEGGWISTDFLLLCRRLKKIGASAKSIIQCLRGAPGFEVRDLPGQEAVRRTSPPPALIPGTVARKDAVFPSLVDHWAAKSKYTLDTMKSIGQDQEELAEAEGSEVDEQERAPAVAGVEGSESPEEQKHWPTRVKQAANQWAAKHKLDGDTRHADNKARARSKREEQTQEHAKKAAVDKTAAKQAAAKKLAAKKAP